MQGSENDTIGGFNSILEQHKKSNDKCFITTVLFDNEYELLHNSVDVKKVKLLTNEDYWTRGSTALLDAIGKQSKLSNVRKRMLIQTGKLWS